MRKSIKIKLSNGNRFIADVDGKFWFQKDFKAGIQRFSYDQVEIMPALNAFNSNSHTCKMFTVDLDKKDILGIFIGFLLDNDNLPIPHPQGFSYTAEVSYKTDDEDLHGQIEVVVRKDKHGCIQLQSPALSTDSINKSALYSKLSANITLYPEDVQKIKDAIVKYDLMAGL